MIYRIASMFLGVLFVALAALSVMVIVEKHEVLTTIMDGLRGLLFLFMGVGFLVIGYWANGSEAKRLLCEFGREVASKKNLREAGTIFGLAIVVAFALSRWHVWAGR